jgi:hypothetical protein
MSPPLALLDVVLQPRSLANNANEQYQCTLFIYLLRVYLTMLAASQTVRNWKTESLVDKVRGLN